MPHRARNSVGAILAPILARRLTRNTPGAYAFSNHSPGGTPYFRAEKNAMHRKHHAAMLLAGIAVFAYQG